VFLETGEFLVREGCSERFAGGVCLGVWATCSASAPVHNTCPRFDVHPQLDMNLAEPGILYAPDEAFSVKFIIAGRGLRSGPGMSVPSQPTSW
jgi:hypothetical protein